jgi:N-acetylmuramic acid 6-phosphate (MurNAc-6-P) etherase
VADRAPQVLVLLDPAVEFAGREVVAGLEEEGVPFAIGVECSDAMALGRRAAAASALGIGIGGDAARLVVVLAASAGRPYIEGTVADARTIGQQAARIAARRPLV